MSARREFWLDLAERAAKTAAQAAAGVLAGTTVLAIDWRQALLIVGTAVAASVLTSLGSAQIGDVGTASAIRVPAPVQLPDLGQIVEQVRDTYEPRHSATDAWPTERNVARSTVESATAAWERAMRGGQ